MDRRSVIGSLGLAALGLIATASNSLAAVPKVIVPTGTGWQTSGNDFSSLPHEWVQLQGSALQEYNRYLAGLKLQRIEPLQVIKAHAKSKGSVWNKLPPKAWWARMGYTLRVVDRIATQLNSPVEEIVSAYRCPVYNSNCEGAKSGSWHQANVAIDVKFPISPRTVTATARNLRDRGLFKGGVGGYSGFTHIDTRGVNTNW